MKQGLRVEEATVRRGGREILSRISTVLERGQVHALTGPNGSGKSTLLRVLCALWRPDEGEVFLDGVPVSSLPRRLLARRVVLVPQEARFDYELTVEETVAMGRYAHRSRWAPPRAADREAIERSLRLCDLPHLRHRLVTTLSGGEKQRVAVARGLAAEPDFLLLDEPTASLDVRHGLEIFQLLRRLAAEGHGVVVATHELAAVLRFADRVLMLAEGRCLYSGPPAEAVHPSRLERVFRVGAETGHAPSGVPFLVFHTLRESSA